MNILFCTFSYYPAVTGGAERQARLQAQELVRRGHRVTVVCPRSDGLSSETIERVRVIRLCRVERWPVTRISYFLRLFPWLLRHVGKFDLVHVHLANIQADLAVFAARRWRRPTYLKLACGGPVGEVKRLARVALFTHWYGFRHADRIQALSSEIADELIGIGVREDRIVQIPNGIDLDEFAPVDHNRCRQLRAKLDLPADRVTALFVGRLVDYKGIGDLFAAWPQVRLEDVTLVVVGATDEDVSAPPGVIVRRWVPSPKEYMQAADVFVHPSHADGMSNAVLEAMACGLPLVATKHGATHGFMEDGHEALLVPAGDPRALAAALERALSEPTLRRSLATAARESAGRYGLSRVVDRIESEHHELVKSRPRAGFVSRIGWSLRS
jgi:glycosyltransferase involved in cell wall biosynthesis